MTSSNSASRVASLVVLWVAGMSVAAVIIWQAISQAGSPDPLVPHLGFSVAALDIGVLVFREGLECILVLTAVTASMGASSEDYRGPVAFGAGSWNASRMSSLPDGFSYRMLSHSLNLPQDIGRR